MSCLHQKISGFIIYLLISCRFLNSYAFITIIINIFADKHKWLSDKLSKDSATVSMWVTITTQPNLVALIAIANALEVPVQELV